MIRPALLAVAPPLFHSCHVRIARSTVAIASRPSVPLAHAVMMLVAIAEAATAPVMVVVVAMVVDVVDAIVIVIAVMADVIASDVQIAGSQEHTPKNALR